MIWHDMMWCIIIVLNHLFMVWYIISYYIIVYLNMTKYVEIWVVKGIWWRELTEREYFYREVLWHDMRCGIEFIRCSLMYIDGLQERLSLHSISALNRPIRNCSRSSEDAWRKGIENQFGEFGAAFAARLGQVQCTMEWKRRKGKEREGGEGIAGAEECVLGPYK